MIAIAIPISILFLDPSPSSLLTAEEVIHSTFTILHSLHSSTENNTLYSLQGNEHTVGLLNLSAILVVVGEEGVHLGRREVDHQLCLFQHVLHGLCTAQHVVLLSTNGHDGITHGDVDFELILQSTKLVVRRHTIKEDFRIRLKCNTYIVHFLTTNTTNTGFGNINLLTLQFIAS